MVPSAAAVVFHTPGVDLTQHLEALRWQPLRFETVAWPPSPPRDTRTTIYLIEASCLPPVEAARATLRSLRQPNAAILIAGADEALIDALAGAPVDGWLELPLPPLAFRTALLAAIENVALRQQNALLRSELDEHNREVTEIHQVGIALSAEKDFDKLQNFILSKCCEMTNADAGTLYLIEEDSEGNRILRFSYARNDSIQSSYRRLTMPLNKSSMAGYVAMTGNVICIHDSYDLPPDAEYSFNPDFDRAMGYRTKSQLVVPLVNHDGETVGVIQLMNRKLRRGAVLSTPEVVEREVIAFTPEDQSLVRSFASQAAVALDNKMLLDSIQNLFEGFVKASVTAIESRDPTTYGHSGRVAALTVGLAEEVNKIHVGRFASIYFDDESMRELRYASLLHDFGKVGVREAVLLKAKKLYEWDLEIIRKRFGYLKALLRAEHSERKLRLALERSREQFLAEAWLLDEEHDRQLRRLDDYLRAVVAANEPAVMEQSSLDMLQEIAGVRFLDDDGQVRPLLDTDELGKLSIRRGSLDPREREEINSHVSHTYRFLREIPWTRNLHRLPTIAYGHHELLDGSGYPLGLRGEEIPIQSRMMTIADIFDALTAHDRPYKAAVPLDRALQILGYEVKDQHIDQDLLEIFVERRVFERTLYETRAGELEPALAYRV